MNFEPTPQGARQKFDFRWTVLAAASILLASVSLLELSPSSAALVGMVAAGMLVAGFAARRLLIAALVQQQFRLVQRLRLLVGAAVILIAAALNRHNETLILILAVVLVWLVCISAFLQIAGRYAPAQANFFPYVQYLGDFWIAIFLAVYGSPWMLVAGVLAIAAPTAMVAIPQRDKRLLPVVILSVAALFLFGIPPEGRLLGIYLIAVVALPAWSAHHLVLLANHLAGLTASASDESATH
jgi:hypothetical protein